MKPLRQTWPDDLAEHYRASGYWRGETFSQMLRARAALWPDRVIIVGGEVRWTYRELLGQAERTAAGLLSLGLRPGDRVVVQLPNIPEFFAVVFGLFRAGLIPVYALPAHRLTEIAHFARKAEAAAYVCADSFGGFDYRGLARELRAAVPAIRHVVVAGDAAEFTPLAGFRADACPLPPDASPSDVAFLQISGAARASPS